MLANVALAGLNTVLALALGAVYVRNHAAIKSPFTLGLLIFAVFLVVHNGVQVYDFFTMMGTPPSNEVLLLAENLLQAAGLVALVSATMR